MTAKATEDRQITRLMLFVDLVFVFALIRVIGYSVAAGKWTKGEGPESAVA